MPEAPKQRSTESYGVGQSGYAAGRKECDLALEGQLEDRNVSYGDDDELVTDLGDDDRFTGRGGRRWAPEATKPEEA